jgi:hypothetical protein
MGIIIIAAVITVVEEEQCSAATCSLLLHKHAVIEITSAWNDQRVVRWHALKLPQHNWIAVRNMTRHCRKYLHPSLNEHHLVPALTQPPPLVHFIGDLREQGGREVGERGEGGKGRMGGGGGNEGRFGRKKHRPNSSRLHEEQSEGGKRLLRHEVAAARELVADSKQNTANDEVEPEDNGTGMRACAPVDNHAVVCEAGEEKPVSETGVTQKERGSKQQVNKRKVARATRDGRRTWAGAAWAWWACSAMWLHLQAAAAEQLAEPEVAGTNGTE